MIIINILILLVIAALCIIILPKSCFLLYKIIIYLMLIVVAFLLLFFTLRSPIDPVNLNVDLHPWKNYILPRWGGIFIASATFFLLSQIPFSLREKKKYIRKEIFAYSLLIIVSASLATIYGTLYYCPKELQACNEVVGIIEDYNSHHEERCVNLGQLGLKHVKDYWYEYKAHHYSIHDYNLGYTLQFCGNYRSVDDRYYTYNSEKDTWEAQ